MPAYSPPEEPSRKPGHPGRGLLVAGVAAAALMGVGLGLWARPAMSERRLALAAVETVRPAVTRTLQIVVDDNPAPLGAPIELLPASGEARHAPPPERLSRDLLAPIRPATGLVRVQTVEPEPAEPPPKAAPRPVPKPALRKPAPPKIRKAAATTPTKPVLKKVEKTKVVEKARPRPAATKVAKAEPPPRKVERTQKARTEKAVLKRPAKPAVVMHASARTVAQKPPSPKAQKAKVEVRKPKPPPRVEKVVQAVKPARAAPLKPAKGAGPVRIAKAQPRPDTAIRDADRQMNRAYSSARAAGVPDWQLRRQQARWEAARASAAREAPWAVRDVYLARIAELHDLTKDAQASGY